jgi:hypothetical protein
LCKIKIAIDLKKEQVNKMSDDLVARWDIALADGKYRVEFEHGTTSGRRVIRVNDKVNLNLF